MSIALSDKQKKELTELYLEAFPEDGAEYIGKFIDRTDYKNIITFYDNDILVSVCYIVDKQVMFYNDRIKAPYLSAVATKNEFRGKGIVKNVMNGAIIELYNRGSLFTLLHPFNYNYYNRYGFTNVTTASSSAIVGGQDYLLRRMQPQDIDSVMAIYSHLTSNKAIYQIVDKQSLMAKLQDNELMLMENYVVSDDGNVFAFVVLDNGKIDFVVTCDNDKLIKTNQLKGLEFIDFCGSSEPFLQARVISAKKVIDNYKHLLTSNVKFQLIDNIIAGNNFVFEIENNIAHYYDCASANETVVPLDIMQFTDMVFNCIDANDKIIFDKY